MKEVVREMNKRTAAVIGATGLVGQELVNELCNRNEYESVIVITRRPINQEHPKLKVKIIDFNYLEAHILDL